MYQQCKKNNDLINFCWQMQSKFQTFYSFCSLYFSIHIRNIILTNWIHIYESATYNKQVAKIQINVRWHTLIYRNEFQSIISHVYWQFAQFLISCNMLFASFHSNWPYTLTEMNHKVNFDLSLWLIASVSFKQQLIVNCLCLITSMLIVIEIDMKSYLYWDWYNDVWHMNMLQ